MGVEWCSASYTQAGHHQSTMDGMVVPRLTEHKLLPHLDADETNPPDSGENDMCYECDHDYDSLADEIALEGRQEWDHESRLGDDMSEYDAEDDDWSEEDEIREECGDVDESMDGDFDSAMASAGFGTDEDYGHCDSGDFGGWDD